MLPLIPLANLAVGEIGTAGQILGNRLGAPALCSAIMPTAEQIWPGVQ